MSKVPDNSPQEWHQAGAWLVCAPLTARVPKLAQMERSRKAWWRKFATKRDASEMLAFLKAQGVRGARIWLAEPRESPSLRAQRQQEFAEYRHEMAQPVEPTPPLPEPNNGPSFGRSPGLSKSGAAARHVNDTR